MAEFRALAVQSALEAELADFDLLLLPRWLTLDADLWCFAASGRFPFACNGVRGETLTALALCRA